MGKSFKSKFNAYFKDKGNFWIVAVTVMEFIYYIAYTVIFLILNNTERNVVQSQVYRWVFTIILFIALVYFLWHSVRIIFSVHT